MTLSELKKEASNYVWTLSAHPFGHKSLGKPRNVIKQQTNAIMFADNSWLYWPKANECCFFMSSGELCFSVDLGSGAMTYVLRSNGGIK